MNKTELTVKLAAKTGLPRRDAQVVVDAIFSPDKNGIIAAELLRGKKVTITGFGGFEVRRRKQRTGRNPQTGAEIKIPASRFPAFHAGKALKDSVRR